MSVRLGQSALGLQKVCPQAGTMVIVPYNLSNSDLEEAELIITVWIIQFLDPDRPQYPAMGPGDLIGRLRDHGWRLVRDYPATSSSDSAAIRRAERAWSAPRTCDR